MPSHPAEPAALWRTTCLGGAWQMACDDWLLDRARPALRLYRWSQPTLSLGFHQRYLEPHWRDLARSGELALVRRPSGGAAVLHAGGLTYALIWAQPPVGRQQAYRQACRWLQLAFARLGQPLHFGQEPAGAVEGNCFASRTPADLVHRGGAKRVGSAQLWRRGCLLQHGEILVDPPAGLWRSVFGTDPPPLPPLGAGTTELEALLLEAAREALPLAIAAESRPWRGHELAAIAERLSRYQLEPAGCLASPEASIDPTTWGSASPSG
jgi:lipoate-protein ligase A